MKPFDFDNATYSLQYDIFQRYRLVFEIISALFNQPTKKNIRILDIGCGKERLTEKFLPDHFEIIRADVDQFGDKSTILLTPNEPLPFSDNEFDVVIAIDVLEHIPKAGRDYFIKETSRVCNRMNLLCYPEGTDDVQKTENRLSEYSTQVFGSRNNFLDEHEEFGLPKSKVTNKKLEACGLKAMSINAIPLDMWLLLGLMDFLFLSLYGDGHEKDSLNAFANRTLPPKYKKGCAHYRAFTIGVRTDDDLKTIQSQLGHLETSEPSPIDFDFCLTLCDKIANIGDGIREKNNREDSVRRQIEIDHASILDTLKDALIAKETHIGKLETDHQLRLKTLTQDHHEALNQLTADYTDLSKGYEDKERHIKKLETNQAQQQEALAAIQTEYGNLAKGYEDKERHIKKLETNQVQQQETLAAIQTEYGNLAKGYEDKERHIEKLEAAFSKERETLIQYYEDREAALGLTDILRKYWNSTFNKNNK